MKQVYSSFIPVEMVEIKCWGGNMPFWGFEGRTSALEMRNLSMELTRGAIGDKLKLPDQLG